MSDGFTTVFWIVIGAKLLSILGVSSNISIYSALIFFYITPYKSDVCTRATFLKSCSVPPLSGCVISAFLR